MRKIIVLAIIFCVCTTCIVCAAMYSVLSSPKGGLESEPNATVGIMPGVDLAQRKAELQQLLDESMIAFSINTNPEFYDGTSEGNLMAENPAHNNKFLVVEIYLSDSDELVFQSKALQPGTYLEKAALSTELPKGEYKAIAYFKGYALDTEEYVGQTGAEILLHVNN